jgi:hypothetical protein
VDLAVMVEMAEVCSLICNQMSSRLVIHQLELSHSQTAKVEESAVITLLLRARAQRAEQSQLQSGSAGVVAVAVQVVRSHSHLLVQFLPQDLNPMELPRSRSAAVEVPVGTTLLLAEQEQALVAERSQSDSAALVESQVTVDLS